MVLSMKTSVIGVCTLALYLMGCGYQAQIDKATQEAESSVQLSNAAAANAQNSAKQAAEATRQAQHAARGTWDSVNRANDAVARLELRPQVWP
jgi:uncharacterized lipoprotein NlpE involved in copper resistance